MCQRSVCVRGGKGGLHTVFALTLVFARKGKIQLLTITTHSFTDDDKSVSKCVFTEQLSVFMVNTEFVHFPSYSDHKGCRFPSVV